jgi:hypothetical protein
MLGREYISRIFIVKNIENQQEALLEFMELKIPPLNAKQDHFL